MIAERVLEQYENLKDISINQSAKQGKEIIHMTMEKALPTRELKLLLQKVLCDIYSDRYIKEAYVLLQPKGEGVFIDISVLLSDNQSNSNYSNKRTKQFHLKDIWMSRSIRKQDRYTNITYSTPYFYNSNTNGNQLLISVTVDNEDPYQYVISSCIEQWDNKNVKTVSTHKVQRVNTDKAYPRAGVVDFFNKVLNLDQIYQQSINTLLYEENYRPECPNDLDIELWSAHTQYIDL